MNLEQIDTSTTAGKAEVMRLAAEGRKVAYAPIPDLAWSIAADEPSWNWRACDYAIIAEPAGPEEVWAVVHDDGSVLDLSLTKLETAEHQSLVRYIRADLAGEVKS